MYADDIQVFAYPYDANELIVKLNSDLVKYESAWLINNQLQIHPSKSKVLFIGSSFNLNNMISEQPLVINNLYNTNHCT